MICVVFVVCCVWLCMCSVVWEHVQFVMCLNVVLLLLLCATAGAAIARLSHRNCVRASVRLSHGWMRQKWWKVGSSNVHHWLAQRL